jgi:hypothetical protein
MNNSINYATRDLGEAATLLTLGMTMTDVIWKDKVAFFVFAGKVQCAEIGKQYFFGNVQVSARALVDNIKNLKKQVFSFKEKQTGRGVK